MRVPRVQLDEADGLMPTPSNYAKHILAVGKQAVPRVTISDKPHPSLAKHTQKPDVSNIIKSHAASGHQAKIEKTREAAAVNANDIKLLKMAIPAEAQPAL